MRNRRATGQCSIKVRRRWNGHLLQICPTEVRQTCVQPYQCHREGQVCWCQSEGQYSLALANLLFVIKISFLF